METSKRAISSARPVAKRLRVKTRVRDDEETARWHAARNADFRAALLSEFGALTGPEVVKRALGAMTSSSLSRLRKDGKVIAVDHQGQTLYPTYQFDPEGRPRPIIAEVLAIFGGKARGWEPALWFVGNNGWLGGRRPVDLMDSDPAAVAEAAKREVEIAF